MTSDTTTRLPVIAWILWGVSVFLGVALLVLVAAVAPGSEREVLEVVGTRIPVALVAILGATASLIILKHQPRNVIGWIFLSLALGAAIEGTFNVYSAFAILVTESALPGGAVAAWLGDAALGTLFVLLIPLTIFFPNGSLPSPRWRFLLVLVAAAAAFVFIGSFGDRTALPTAVGVWVENPFQVDESLAGVIRGTNVLGLGLGFVGLALVAAGLVQRYRVSGGEERQQIKWVAYFTILVVAFHSFIFLLPAPFQALGPITALAWVAAIWLSIMKYRLYDIDLVINKTVVYGALAAFIGGVYVTIVVGIGELIGARANNVALAIAATVIVAVAFEPVRQRVQRFANRVVHGERATPYEVMADFSHRMAGAVSIEELLPRTAETAATGVGAEASRVKLVLPDGTARIELWPTASDATGFDHTFTVTHGDETVGEIAVAKPAGEPLTPAEQRLIEDLAYQAGLAFANARLTLELQERLTELSTQAAELEASRARIVTAADTERRRLEEEIHTEVGRPLVLLQQGIRHTRDVVTTQPEQATHQLDDLITDANETLDSLRELARGVFPPLLADQGIHPALNGYTLKAAAPVTIETQPGFGDLRFSPEVEGAIYFCCIEAIRAARDQTTIHLGSNQEGVSYTITLTHPLDPTTIQRINDRVAALGGTLHTNETTLTANIRTRALEVAGATP